MMRATRSLSPSQASDYTTPDFARSALITIDTQCDVLDGAPFEVSGTSAVLPNMRALVEAFRAAGRPIVHIVRIYQADGSNVDLCRRRAVEDGMKVLAPGSAGVELAAELLPRPDATLDAKLLLSGAPQQLEGDEVAIYKPRWGAFFETRLEEHLRKRGASTVVFAGCNFPNCPRTSIYEASERDFRIVLAQDAISGLYDRGKDELRGIGVRLMATRKIVREL